MSDSIETLGTILKKDFESRDAVHVAIVALTASQELMPGTHVGLVANNEAGKCKEPLGIVDPFLSSPVEKGQRFWLFIYPKQITGLKHVWTHASFDGKLANEEGRRAKEASELWLRRFCETSNCPSYETVIKLVENRLEPCEWNGSSSLDGEYMHFAGYDASGDIPDEFWNHVETVTGLKPPRAKYFSCSC